MPQLEPTPWVSSLTYSLKANGTLEVCLDLKDLNKAIIHEHHKAPTLDEIAHKLASLGTYSKLDAKIEWEHISHKKAFS